MYESPEPEIQQTLMRHSADATIALKTYIFLSNIKCRTEKFEKCIAVGWMAFDSSAFFLLFHKPKIKTNLPPID